MRFIFSCLITFLYIGIPTSAMATDSDKREPSLQSRTADQPIELDSVYVTGSNIKRRNLDDAGATRVIGTGEIERSGAKSLKELFRKVPGMFIGADDDSVDTFAPGASGVNWRGLGGQSVLILINGRRVVNHAQPNGLEAFTDLNSLPLSALDRVEILRDGASAIYGADAIAGVINLILKKNYSEKSVQIDGAMASAGDGQSISSTVSWGKGDLSTDHYNAYAIIEARRLLPFEMGKRSGYLGSSNYQPWGYRDYSLPIGASGLVSYARFGDPTKDESFLFAETQILGTCPTAPLDTSTLSKGAVGKYCPYNFKDDLKTASSDHIGLTSVFTAKPNVDLTLFSEIMLSQNNSTLNSMNTNYSGILPSSHPQYSATLNELQILGDVNINSFLLGSNIGNKSTVDFSRLVIGADYFLGDWDSESAIMLNRSVSKSNFTSTILKDKLAEKIQSGEWIFGDEANNKALLPLISTGLSSRYQTDTISIDTKATKELYQLKAGPIKSAFGFELRRESITTNVDTNSSGGLYLSDKVERGSFENSRDIASAYGELAIPISNKLEAQIAIRHDAYSGNDSASSPKIALVWNPTPNWRLRGSFATGYRPPNLVESSDSEGAIITNLTDKQRCNATFTNGCMNSVKIGLKKNPDLKSEKSKSLLFGLDWSPKDDTNLVLDYWRIKRTGGIGIYDINRVLANPDKFQNDPAITVVRDVLDETDRQLGAEAGKITAISVTPVNLAENDLSGLDFSITNSFGLGEYGRITTNLNFTHNLSFKSSLFPGDTLEELIGTSMHPKNQATLEINWSKGPWTIETSAQFIGQMANRDSFERICEAEVQGAPNLCGDIPAFIIFNGGVEYTGFRGWKIKLTALNLLDTSPPFVANPVGFNTLHSFVGRYISAQAKYIF